MPGWNFSAWGYHGDDGKFYAESGTGTSYSETFGTGDVVGCEICLNEGVTFTKNGTPLGKNTGGHWYIMSQAHIVTHRCCNPGHFRKVVSYGRNEKLWCSCSSKLWSLAFHV
jgi:hypothetical protein